MVCFEALIFVAPKVSIKLPAISIIGINNEYRQVCYN